MEANCKTPTREELVKQLVAHCVAEIKEMVEQGRGDELGELAYGVLGL